MWRCITSLISNKTKNVNNEIKFDDGITTDLVDLSQRFNDYFITSILLRAMVTMQAFTFQPLSMKQVKKVANLIANWIAFGTWVNVWHFVSARYQIFTQLKINRPSVWTNFDCKKQFVFDFIFGLLEQQSLYHLNAIMWSF